MTCSRVAEGASSCVEQGSFPGDWCSSCRAQFDSVAGVVCPECGALVSDEGEGPHDEECSQKETA